MKKRKNEDLNIGYIAYKKYLKKHKGDPEAIIIYTKNEIDEKYKEYSVKSLLNAYKMHHRSKFLDFNFQNAAIITVASIIATEFFNSLLNGFEKINNFMEWVICVLAIFIVTFSIVFVVAYLVKDYLLTHFDDYNLFILPYELKVIEDQIKSKSVELNDIIEAHIDKDTSI